MPLHHRNETEIDVEKVNTCLRDEVGWHKKIDVSVDPGRFVCNYTYFLSTQYSRDRSGIKSIFVHVPPFHAENEEIQLKFLASLLVTLQKIINDSNS